MAALQCEICGVTLVAFAVAQLCRKASALLAERNRLCKLNKN